MYFYIVITALQMWPKVYICHRTRLQIIEDMYSMQKKVERNRNVNEM